MSVLCMYCVLYALDFLFLPLFRNEAISGFFFVGGCNKKKSIFFFFTKPTMSCYKLMITQTIFHPSFSVRGCFEYKYIILLSILTNSKSLLTQSSYNNNIGIVQRLYPPPLKISGRERKNKKNLAVSFVVIPKKKKKE